MIQWKLNAVHEAVFDEVETLGLERKCSKLRRNYSVLGLNLNYLTPKLRAINFDVSMSETQRLERNLCNPMNIYFKCFNFGMIVCKTNSFFNVNPNHENVKEINYGI